MSALRHRSALSRRAFSAGLTLSAFAATSPATVRHVAAAQQTPIASSMFRYRFGDAEVCLFDIDTWDESASFFAANATREELQAVAKEYGPFTLSVTATLLDTGEHLVLMDTGSVARLSEKLVQAGYDPDDVDLVTISHIHYDHYNGVFEAFMRGDLSFPNARYVVSATELEYWLHDDGRPVSEYAEPNMDLARDLAQEFIATLGDKLVPVEWEEEILPGIRLLPAIGHTGGHSAVEITSGDEMLLHVGDLILNPVLNLAHPDWTIAPAVWPEEDLASRRVLMDRAADEHTIVQTVHFPFPGVGYVEHDGDAWKWIPLEGSATPVATP